MMGALTAAETRRVQGAGVIAGSTTLLVRQASEKMRVSTPEWRTRWVRGIGVGGGGV